MTIGKMLRKRGAANIKKIKFGKKRKPLPKAPPPAPAKVGRRVDVIARAKRESQKRKIPLGPRVI